MSRLDKFVTDIVSAVKEKYPEVKIKVTPPLETEDVDIEIYAPKKIKSEVFDFATDLTYEIGMNEGYNIAALVMPDENLKEGALPQSGLSGKLPARE